MKKAFVGISALLAAFPTTFATGEHDQQMQPLLSGSVCRVRDSLDFLDPKERAKITFQKRLNIAKGELEVGPTCHITNGDEENVTNFAGQFHKSLPHDQFGQVDPDAYQKLLDCVFSSDINVCDQVPSGAEQNGAKMVNPLGGTAHQVDGADSDSVFIKIPSALLSEEMAAQMVELYWMALVRDVPFSQFATNEFTRLAAFNLQALPAFKGFAIPKSDGDVIDPVRDLFRTDWPGVTSGPVVSQFMLANYTLDGTEVEPKLKTLVPGVDYMTAFQPWLDVQNGASEVETEFVEEPLFLRNGRDLSALAFVDLIYSEALRAALVMIEQGILSSSGGPYTTSTRQVGFATFGEPHFLTALAASSSSTRHAWYAKWQVHRLLRPEAYGALVHNSLMNTVETPLPDSILRNTELLNRVEVRNQQNNSPNPEKTFLLPMSVAEGSPVHPAYPSGHSINIGAYITVLKAFIGFETGQRCYPKPVVSNDEGTERVDFVAGANDQLDVCVGEDGTETTGLTYEGELNKVASNVIIGRSHIGVHWRMDGVYGALMGETSAIRRLQQELGGLSEARQEELIYGENGTYVRKSAETGDDTDGRIPPATYTFRLYSGKMIEIFGPGLYSLDGQLCKGKYTGDDFCDEEQEMDTAFEHIISAANNPHYAEL